MKCKWYLCSNEAKGKSVYCSRKCSNTACVTKRRQQLKIQAIEYKGGKCVNCGYDKCVRALTFHHLDPNEKDFAIGSGNTIRWEKVKVELDKCIMVCANCHAEIHEQEYKEKVIQG